MIYPLGILTLVLHSFSFNPSPSGVYHYLEFSKGARTARYMAFPVQFLLRSFLYFGESHCGVRASCLQVSARFGCPAPLRLAFTDTCLSIARGNYRKWRCSEQGMGESLSCS